MQLETAEERLSRLEAPVKWEFCRFADSRVAYIESAATAVSSRVGAQQHEKPMIQIAQGAPKKSKKVMRQERQQRRNAGTEVCKSFVLGRCSFENSCKFSHDVATFVAQRPTDLVGPCPFMSSDCCPFGIACRWATAHLHPDELTKTYLQLSPVSHALQLAVQQRGDGAVAAKDQIPQLINNDPAGMINEESTSRDDVAPQERFWYRHDGTVPTLPLGIIPSDNASSSMNTLPKNLQSRLWKNDYEFPRADTVLEALGLENKQKQSRKSKGKGDGQKRQLPSQKGAGGLEHDAGENETVEGGERQHKRLKASGNEHQIVGDRAYGAEDVEDGKRTSDETFLKGISDVEGGAGTTDGGATTISPEHVAQNKPKSGTAMDDDALQSTETWRQHSEHTPAADPSSIVTPSLALVPPPPPQQHQSFECSYQESKLGARERRQRIDFRGKTFLAPLTTVGNLPFRRLCKRLGADITCGEMAMATNLLMGQASEWALLRRHPDEDCFGVQVCGGYPDAMARCAELIDNTCQVDFVDVNFGCPIDCVVNKNAGSAVLQRPKRMCDIVSAMSSLISCPLTLKMRKGYFDGKDVAHDIIPQVAEAGAAAVTLHGRTREQRYSRMADWSYIKDCATAAQEAGIQLVGNGDVMSWHDHERAVNEFGAATTYVARGALIKPWVFTEIKEKRDWDISASERLDIVRRFAAFGLEHWGSDDRGVNTTRKYLLEWLSFAHRYVPVGLLEVLPQRTNLRPPAFVGRSDLETLLSSPDPRDWIAISELVLGPTPTAFSFTPKHKATSYGPANGRSGGGGGGGGSKAGNGGEVQENG